MSDFVIVNGELYHHGVKGMKWGVRKSRRHEIKQQYRKRTDKAFSEYERTIASIEKPYKRGQNLSKKDQAREAAAEKRYSDTVAKAKADYKQAKKARKEAIKSTTDKLRKEASLADKLIFNDATRKKAAKYMVDNNMSVAEATRKAKGDAWRNTAIFVAGFSAYTVASMRK